MCRILNLAWLLYPFSEFSLLYPFNEFSLSLMTARSSIWNSDPHGIWVLCFQLTLTSVQSILGFFHFIVQFFQLLKNVQHLLSFFVQFIIIYVLIWFSLLRPFQFANVFTHIRLRCRHNSETFYTSTPMLTSAVSVFQESEVGLPSNQQEPAKQVHDHGGTHLPKISAHHIYACKLRLAKIRESHDAHISWGLKGTCL